MYTLDTTLGELIALPQVHGLLEKVAPQMVSGPAAAYVTPMKLSQLKAMQEDAGPMVDAILSLANGEEIDLAALDPSKKKAVIKEGPIVAKYDLDDVDGKMYMLDHRFSGRFIVTFSKTMDESKKGKVSYEGKDVDYILCTVSIAGGLQFLGIYVRDICNAYSTPYTFHFEGFVDTDGNEIDPQDYTVWTTDKIDPDPKYQEHEAVALKAAEEGMVLLKNNNHLLPLAADSSIATFNSNFFRDGAVGAGKINPRYHVRLDQAIAESRFTLSDDADTALIVISRASGENFDNGSFQGDFYLTDQEETQIAAAKEKYAHIIAIINSGYPMDVRWTLDDQIEAVIWTGFSGMLGGKALVNILNGSVTPSGKLPDTWSLDYFDIPSARNFYVAPSAEEAIGADDDIWIDTVYEEDIYVGYRYFETFEKPVAYPFGHGLSYTDFEIKASLASSAIDDIKLHVDVKNTGDYDGKEVVQIYAAIPDGKLEQPALRLVEFAKTDSLAAGRSQSMDLAIDKYQLASYEEESHSYILEAGSYKLYAGSSIKEITLIGQINIAEGITVKTVGDYMTPPIDFTRLSKKDPTNYPKGQLSGIIENVHELQHTAKRAHIDDMETLEDSFIDGLSLADLAQFCVCASSGWGMQDVGVAGRINRLGGEEIPYYAVSDGNNGVNINQPNIGMPTSNLVCASWNRDLAYQVARVIAEEAKENNVNMILAPAMNIHRNPLCGRHPEYFSEDPYLGGIMAGFHTKGLEENGMASSMKHVCCNGAESSRKRNHSIVSKRALREIYLRTFEVAFSVQKPSSIMTGYNACNGSFTACDEEMLQGIFRREFGLEGYVMTDWNSYDTADIATAAQAGNCWFTPGSTDTTYSGKLIEGIESGLLEESRLRQNAKYLHRVISR